MLPWERIDTVLLDMDGTLLDLYFDNHFWLEHLPRRFGEERGLSQQQAVAELRARYEAVHGTLAWYCLDYWQRELGLDIAALKREIEHLIALRPGALEFLAAARAAGRRVVLVTNAHPASLALKLEKLRLRGYFDAIISSHSLGHPKEALEFWEALWALEPFVPARSLFVDDSLPILATAQRFGVAHTVAVLRPDLSLPERDTAPYPAVHDLRELLAQA